MPVKILYRLFSFLGIMFITLLFVCGREWEPIMLFNIYKQTETEVDPI